MLMRHDLLCPFVPIVSMGISLEQVKSHQISRLFSKACLYDNFENDRPQDRYIGDFTSQRKCLDTGSYFPFAAHRPRLILQANLKQ